MANCVCSYQSAGSRLGLAVCIAVLLFTFSLLFGLLLRIYLLVLFCYNQQLVTVFRMLIPSHKSPVVRSPAAQTADDKNSSASSRSSIKC